MLLHNPQQFRLQSQGHIPDFIQKERTCVCHFETADLLSNGPGEGTLLMSEELAFQQIERDCRAAQRYERASPAPAYIVNGAGNHLFARACLSENQNRGIGWRHALYPREDEFKGSAVANDLFKLV